MKEETISKSSYEAQRKQRVEKLRKTIIILVAVLIIVPIIMCIFLTIKVSTLQKQIDLLYEARTQTYHESNDVVAARAEVTPKNGKGDTAGDTQTRQLKVYLTFDDGPSENTDAILDILAEYNVKATFFAIGQEGEENMTMYQRIVSEGHTLGMHSYSHSYSTVYKSLDDFKSDFYKIQNYIEGVTGVKPVYYRFPGGSNNLVSEVDVKELIKFLDSQGVTYFDWNASNGDSASKQYSTDELIENVLESIEKDADSIVLMHDAKGKYTTVDALPKLIEKLQEQGYELCAIDENTTPVQLLRADESK